MSNLENSLEERVRVYLTKQRTAVDDYLGVSQFWSEKVHLLLSFLQHAAVLWLWRFGLPVYYYRRVHYVLLLVFDVFAGRRHLDPLITAADHTLAHDVICAVVAGLLLAACWWLRGITVQRSVVMNFERVYLLHILRFMYIPILLNGVRYGVLDLPVVIEDNAGTVSSLRVVVFSIVSGAFALAVPLHVLRLARPHNVYRSTVLYDRYVQSKELQYLLCVNQEFRNNRMYLVNSYRRPLWWLNAGYYYFDLALVGTYALFNGQHTLSAKPGSIVLVVLFGLRALGFTFGPRTYRMKSTNVILHLLNWTQLLNVFLCMLQAMGIKNPLLVDSNLDYFLFYFNVSSVGVVIVWTLAVVVASHSIVRRHPSAQEKRERMYWVSRSGKHADAPGSRRDSLSELENLCGPCSENYAETAKLLVRERDAPWRRITHTTPAVRAQKLFRSLSLWPTSDALMEELHRENDKDHFLDVLWDVLDLFDELKTLRATPELVSGDVILDKMRLLKRAVTECRKKRLEHHLGMYHPLHHTFEEMYDGLKFEYDRVRSRAVYLRGEKALKVKLASRYLRRRLDQRYQWRTVTTAPGKTMPILFSPGANRILLKLLCVRMFVTLCDKVLRGSSEDTVGDDLSTERSLDDDDDKVDVASRTPFPHSQSAIDAVDGDGAFMQPEANLAEMEELGDDARENVVLKDNSNSKMSAEGRPSSPPPQGLFGVPAYADDTTISFEVVTAPQLTKPLPQLDVLEMSTNAEAPKEATVAAAEDADVPVIADEAALGAPPALDVPAGSESRSRSRSRSPNKKKSSKKKRRDGDEAEQGQDALLSVSTRTDKTDDISSDGESSEDPEVHRRKKQLRREIKKWKKQFSEEHGRDATKEDVAGDAVVGPLQEEYNALSREKSEEKEKERELELDFASSLYAHLSDDELKARKASLKEELEAFKKSYEAEHGEKPKKKHVRGDAVAGPKYDEYEVISAELKSRTCHVNSAHDDETGGD
eukprot:PhM_4_TR14250/c0_g1_i4/m.8646